MISTDNSAKQHLEYNIDGVLSFSFVYAEKSIYFRTEA